MPHNSPLGSRGDLGLRALGLCQYAGEGGGHIQGLLWAALAGYAVCRHAWSAGLSKAVCTGQGVERCFQFGCLLRYEQTAIFGPCGTAFKGMTAFPVRRLVVFDSLQTQDQCAAIQLEGSYAHILLP